MKARHFLQMYYQPGKVMDELLDQKSLHESCYPGLKLLLIICLAANLLWFAVAWILLHTYLIGGPLAALMLFGGLVNISPLQVVLNFAKSFAQATAVSFVFAWSFDWLQGQLFKRKTGKQLAIFNLYTAVDVPFIPLLLVPVVGWLAFCALSAINGYRLCVKLYGKESIQQAVIALFLSWVPSALAGVVLGLVLSLAFSPFQAPDPSRDLLALKSASAVAAGTDDWSFMGMAAAQPTAQAAQPTPAVAAALAQAAPTPVPRPRVARAKARARRIDPVPPLDQEQLPIAQSAPSQPASQGISQAPAQAPDSQANTTPAGAGIQAEDVVRAAGVVKGLWDIFKK